MPGGWPSQEFQTDALPLTVTADPLAVPNVGWLYSKLVGPITEFFLRRNDGSIAQLTSGSGVVVHTHQTGAEGGQLDHGLAMIPASLLDDDHPQYALADKFRPAVWVSAADLAARSLVELGTRPHAALTALGADDHLQYALADKSRPAPWVSASDLAGRALADLGTRPHASLTALLVDDHTQYALADKSRPSPWVSAADLAARSLADLGTKVHAVLSGLAADDHVQYALADKSRPAVWVSAADLTPRALADLGTRPHASLTALLVDDHTQYALADKSRPAVWVSAADLAVRSLADLGTRVHGSLTSLLADDHTQYALADKSRPAVWVAAADLTPRSIADLGTRTHALLTGLAADDHPQYQLKSILTTKGDLYAATAAATVTRLGVGADGFVLTADALEATGMKWAAAGGGGITGAGVAGRMTFWDGVSSVTSDAGFTYDSVNDRLAVPIIQLGANATPAAGDVWFVTPDLLYRTAGGTKTIINAEDPQTVSGIKTFTGGPVFNTVTPKIDIALTFSTPTTPAAAGEFGRTGPVLQFHDGGGVRTLLTDVATTITSIWTFNAAGSSIIVGDEVEFTNAGASATAAGRLRRNATKLTWFDSGVGVGELLCTVSAHTISGVFTFSAAPVFGDGVKLVLNPDGTNAGLNVGQQAGNPSTLVNGDIWYNSATDEFMVRRAGVSEAIATGGSGSSVLSWGAITTAAGGSLLRYDIGSGALPATDNLTARIIMPYAGTLRNLYVERVLAPGVGATSVFTVRINGADSGITCSIAGAAATTANDVANSAAVAAGDRVEIRYTVGGGAPVASNTIASLELVA